MIVVVLLCLLGQLPSAHNQYRLSPEEEEELKKPEWPPESDNFLDQLAKDMFGFSVEELYEQKHDLSHDQYSKILTLWKKVKATESNPKLLDASKKAIDAFYLFDDNAKEAKEEVVKKVKRELSEIWYHLSSKDRKLWKEKFPYAVHIEKLANIRHIVMIGL